MAWVLNFVKNFNIPYESFEQKLNLKGWTFKDADETIKSIAGNNKIRPADIYKHLKPSVHNNQGRDKRQVQRQAGGQGQGWGRKTLQDVCNSLNKNVDAAVSKLSEHGINASKNEFIRDIATNNNLRPIEIINMIENRGEVK